LTINTSLTDLRQEKTTKERDQLVSQFATTKQRKQKREDTNPTLHLAAHQQNHNTIQARAEQLTQQLSRKSTAVMEEVSFTTPPSTYHHFTQEYLQEEGHKSGSNTLKQSSIDKLQQQIRQNKIHILQLEDKNTYTTLPHHTSNRR
jgi:hypothetical protein